MPMFLPTPVARSRVPYYPRTTYVPSKAGGSAAALDGTISISIEPTGSLTTGIALAGSINIGLSPSGALSTGIQLGGTATISVNPTGDLTAGSSSSAAVVSRLYAGVQFTHRHQNNVSWF